MLKRLLVAVFVLGLFLTFSGSAISGPMFNRSKDVSATNPITGPGKNFKDWSTSHPAANQRVPLAQPVSGSEYQSPAGVDTTGCALLDYTNFASCGFYAWWTTSAAGAADQQFSMRFDIPAGHAVNVNGAGIRVYGKAGAPTLVISVYGDNAGIPGALIYSEGYVPLVGNVLYPFSSAVNITDGGPYHIGISVAGGAADSVRLGSDDGVSGVERGSVKLAGVWYPNASIAFGSGCGGPLTDPNWRIVSNVCQYYSQCVQTAPGGTYFRQQVPQVSAFNAIPWGDGSTLVGSGQRFLATGVDTLKKIKVVHRVVNAAFYTGASTNSMIVKVWGDSSGYADLSAGPIYTSATLTGLAQLFPYSNNATGPGGTDTVVVNVPNLPVFGYYHVTAEMTSALPADGHLQMRFGDGSSDFGGGMVKFSPAGSGREWDNIAGNANMTTDFYGTGVGDPTIADIAPCDIRVTTCLDEFSDCKTKLTYDHARMWNWAMVPGDIEAFAHLVKGNPVNRVQKLRFQVRGTGTVGLTAKIFAKTLSGPGALLYSQLVTTPTFYPGWTEVVIPGGVQVLGDFYIGYEVYAPAVGDTLKAQTEDFYLTSKDGGAWLYYAPDLAWYPVTDFSYFDNLMAEAEFCSIPVNERICVTENDWPTFQHDYARTGASNVSLEDAFCDLTTDWSHVRPTGRGTNLNGPIIWNNYVICAFSAATIGSYVVFNLQTGAIVDEIDDATWFNDQSVIGGNIRCTPTVADIGGNPVLLLTGGNPGSLSAFDLSAGFPLAFPGALLWNFNDLGNMGSARYGNVIVINDIVYVADDNNKVYAVDGLTGLSYGGWAGPYTMTYNSQKSGATNGSTLFYSLFNTAGNGKITAIKANDGTLAWDFTALVANTYFTGVTAETFEGGVAFADGAVFANSRVLDGTSDVANLRRGVLYQLNATTGAVITTGPGERARTTTPTIDLNTVIVPILPPFGGGTSATGGNLTGFSRADGQLKYSTTSFKSAQAAGQIGYLVEGLLTCETNVPDLFYAFNLQGYLSCFNADNGDEIYHRRVDHGAGNNQGGMGAVGKDATGAAHLVFTDAYGGIYDMVKGVDRPRLELLAGTAAIAVPFGSPADTVVEFPNMYTNTGCGNLIVSLTASTTSNGTTVPAPGYRAIGSRLSGSADQLAGSMTETAIWARTADGKKVRTVDVYNASTDEGFTFADARETYNKSAAAVPAFLNQNGGSYAGDVFDPAMGNLVLAPGDTAGIRVHANGPLVNRGPNPFFCEFTVINDPDYYIDNTARRPEVALNLVGGCLLDTTTLHFGAASANLRLVTNTSELSESDFTPPYGFDINGVHDISFAGTVAYGVSNRRLAFQANAWDGSQDEWISSQGDPNYCDNDCKPAISTGVALGAASVDGITYAPITGSVVCKSMIDSVQNFDDGAGGWDWSLFGSPFDNDSTMGLGSNTRVIGVVNAPPAAVLLNNMTLDIWDMKERNGVAVPNFKIGAYNDNDVRAIGTGFDYDTTLFDQAHSVGWATAVDAAAPTVPSGVVAGFIKVPFGCGYEPMKNVVAAVADEWVYIPDWDTAYHYMSKPAGAYDQGVATSPQDEGSWFTFAEHDFTAGGTYSFGYAFFSFTGLTNSYSSTADSKIANLATLVNQWSGFGRGDVNNDGVINLADIVYLANNVNYGGPGPIPFVHLGDVNASGGAPDMADVTYLVNYYFSCGACPLGAWTL